jgi:hypothetical protein
VGLSDWPIGVAAVAAALTLAAFAVSFVVPAIRARTAPAPGARPKNEAKTDADAAT